MKINLKNVMKILNVNSINLYFSIWQEFCFKSENIINKTNKYILTNFIFLWYNLLYNIKKHLLWEI